MVLVQDFLLYLWIAALAYGVGFRSLRATGWIASGGAETFWLSTTLGLGFLTALVFALGCFHLFTPLVVFGILVFLTAWLLSQGEHKFHNGSAAEMFLRFVKAGLGLARRYPLRTVALGGGVFAAFLGCGAPEVRGDPIIYHITEAWLFVVNRGHVNIPSSALTYIPQNQQLLYALGLLLGSDSLAKLFHWTMGVLLLAGTYVGALRLGLKRKSALISSLLIALVPTWFYLATTTYIDLATANYLLASVYLGTIGLWTTPSNRMVSAILAGFCLGMAVGTKYTAGVVGALPLLIASAYLGIVTQRKSGRMNWHDIASPLVVLAVTAFFVFAPWLVRNWLWTGNPVAPSFMRWLGPVDAPEETKASPDIQAFALGADWTISGMLKSYAHMFWAFTDYGNYLPVIALLLGLSHVAVRAIGGRKDELCEDVHTVVRSLLIFLVLAFLLGVPLASVRRDSRYVMCHTAILAMLVVFFFEITATSLPTYERKLRRFAGGVVGLLFAAWVIASYWKYKDLREICWPVFDRERREAYCAARLSNYYANLRVGDLVRPEEGKVVGAAYPASVHYVLGGNPVTPDLLRRQATEHLEPEDLAPLRRQGVRFLFGEVAPTLQPYVRLRGYAANRPLWEIVREP